VLSSGVKIAVPKEYTAVAGEMGADAGITSFAAIPADIPLVNAFPVHTLALIAVYALAALLICERRGDLSKVSFYCEQYNRPRRYAWRADPIEQ
jgi:hypothetical protein